MKYYSRYLPFKCTFSFGLASVDRISHDVGQKGSPIKLEGSSESGSTSSISSGVGRVLQYFARKLRLTTDEEQQQKKILDDFSLEGIARYILDGKAKNIITMAGAGISTCKYNMIEMTHQYYTCHRTSGLLNISVSAIWLPGVTQNEDMFKCVLTASGIPDFRSPSTGLYDNLKKYNLPYPEAIITLTYFKSHPEPFFSLAKELLPAKFKPSPCHYFIRLLHEKGLLLRHYTQVSICVFSKGIMVMDSHTKMYMYENFGVVQEFLFLDTKNKHEGFGNAAHGNNNNKVADSVDRRQL
ncbi:hypothetical protein PR048_025270 [Dryococelus australis]|uniref:Deacetylase sirtuin-type domain-containing protein n=1 Tax=Dryococelus australis TaxID=614101 RepID=A0ABQ9GQX4_9NEOP|nr:hypothetical protein PR048_025270 [Dryococelus australis]